MPYLPQTTVAECITAIQKQGFVLPAIQREFIWKPHQVVSLFDSLMRGYPLGSFLSWRVEAETARKFRFYGVMRNYSEFNARHNPVIDVPAGTPVVAVLDGQQRLTSLNIGLRGTYAWRNKYHHTKFPENYPERRLHLNLKTLAEDNTVGLQYDFRFLTSKQLSSMPAEERPYWLPVPTVMELADIGALVTDLCERGIFHEPGVSDRAVRLWQQVHGEKTIQFYEEADQDIERVLDIFIRVNSGGTPLSYSDLLLSIATAQWKDRDARKEIHGLVDELNNTGSGFRFSQDLVLKTGLVLAGIGDIGFKVKNFTVENMQTLSDKWEEIKAALWVSARLLSDFGFSGSNLTASSVLIPVATYVHRRGLNDDYRSDPREARDRQELRDWVTRSLLVPGVWGSGLDGLLRALRDAINSQGSQAFPKSELERLMAARGKSLAATPELVDSLLDLQYAQPSTFAILATLFPHVDTSNHHHVDHVFPIARLSPGELTKAGLAKEEIARIEGLRNSVANLQLLPGLVNIGKSDKLPDSWAVATHPQRDQLESYCRTNALPTLPSDVSEFLDFAEERRRLLAQRLLATLGAQASAEPVEPSDLSLPSLDEAPEGELILN